MLFDVEAGVSDCLACRNQPRERRHSVTQTQASKRSKLIQFAFLVENPLKWIKLFLQWSLCGSSLRTRLGWSRGARNRTEKVRNIHHKSKVVGFINNLYNMNGKFDKSMVFFQSSRRSRQRRQSVSPSWDSSGSS